MDREHQAISACTITQSLLVAVVIPFLPLLISQDWGWWEAWSYAIVGFLGFVISRVLAARRHPDLLTERAGFREHENAKRWDRVLAPLVALGGSWILLIAGFEKLFGRPTSFSWPVKALSLTAILAGYGLGSYAMYENRFFSGMVRIQVDRGHHVVSSGPYRWVRHPGYTGALLVFMTTPLFLDSPWSFLVAVPLTLLLVVRTDLEDRTLHAELQGYTEYASRVRYRLLPGVW